MFWTISAITGAIIGLFAFIVPVVIASIIDITGNTCHLFARTWARFILRCANTRVRVQGAEHLPKGPAVYMPNHQSHFDVVAILGYLDNQFRWTAKKELFEIPVFGLGMRRSGYIEIDRKNHDKALQSLDAAADKIRSGTSIVIFPEGTRSSDGKLRQEFKKGGFHLSMHSGAPVVPISVLGSRDVLAKNSRKVTPGLITLKIGEPIDPAGHDIDTFMEAVHKGIEKGLIAE